MRPGQFGHAQAALAQGVEHGAAGGVGECGEDGVELGGVELRSFELGGAGRGIGRWVLGSVCESG